MDNLQRMGQHNQRFESRRRQTPEEKTQELRKRIKETFALIGKLYLVSSALNF